MVVLTDLYMSLKHIFVIQHEIGFVNHQSAEAFNVKRFS